MKHPTDKGLPAEGLPVCAAECAEHADGTTTNTPSAAQQQIAGTVPAGRTKRRPGAPEGMANGNALHLLKSKATARVTRDKHRRSAERLVRDALDSAGLSEHPLARMIGRNLVRLEAAAGRCEERADRRGYFNAKGVPSPAFSKLTEVVGQQLAEFRKMLESLEPVASERRIVVTVIDDPAADDGGKTISAEDLARWEARRATPGSALGPRYDDLTLAARLAAGEVRLPDESTLETDFEDPDDVSALRPPEGQRRPDNARRRVSSASTPPTTPAVAHAPDGRESTAPKTLIETFLDADAECRRRFDRGGFGGLGSIL